MTPVPRQRDADDGALLIRHDEQIGELKVDVTDLKRSVRVMERLLWSVPGSMLLGSFSATVTLYMAFVRGHG